MEPSLPKHRPVHHLPVFPVLAAQMIALLLASVVLYVALDAVAGYSALAGGLIGWLPNLYFARKAFRYSGARSAQLIVRSFYAGEAGKLILTAVLFALLFAGVKPLNVPVVFGVFVLTQLVSWFAPLLMKRLSRP